MNEMILIGWLHLGQENGNTSKILAKSIAQRNKLALLGSFFIFGGASVSASTS